MLCGRSMKCTRGCLLSLQSYYNTVIVSELIEWTGLGRAEFVCAH